MSYINDEIPFLYYFCLRKGGVGMFAIHQTRRNQYLRNNSKLDWEADDFNTCIVDKLATGRVPMSGPVNSQQTHYGVLKSTATNASASEYH
jgi:hypothetical protein